MPSVSVIARPPSWSALLGRSVKKHDRCPVWQTLPSPSRAAFTSTVSSSQSVKICRTARRLPEVSPLVHSVLRVRLKNVT